MKQQINLINLVGAGISVSLLVFSHFYPARGASFKGLKRLKRPLPQNREDEPLKCSSVDLPNNIQEQMPTESSTSPLQQFGCDKIEESSKQPPFDTSQEVEFVELVKEPESVELDKCQQSPIISNGCPKNLDYFMQNPRPKQMPEECFTCKNLITCVCSTDSQRSS
jgi:hypothetical protein